jgi:hypothetical protein
LARPDRYSGVTVDLKLEDIDRLAQAGGSLADRLFELDEEIQRELGVADWRELDIRLDLDPLGLVEGRVVVERALANMGA